MRRIDILNSLAQKARKSPLGNERGSILIFTAVALVSIFAFAVLAIDGAILMTSRTELSAAADAAALAGATGLISGSQDEARTRAMNTSALNEAVQDVQRPVVISADDVTFPEPDIIRVQTHRTAETGDAIRTYFLHIINPMSTRQADMTAVAAARAFDVCGSKCIKPWSVPDRWNDANNNGVFDAGDSYDKDIDGYIAPNDVGASITLKVGSPSETIASGVFFVVDLPPLDDDSGIAPQTGGAEYRWNIANCNEFTVGPGDRLQVEPGNMVGPTTLGMQELIDADPWATWDPSTKSIVNSAYALSPRIGLIPFFDPQLPPTSGRNYVTITKIGAFFLESVGPGSQVNGKFIQVTIQGEPCPYQGIDKSLVKGIVLVE